MSKVIHIETISDIHHVFGIEHRPKHPLVSIIRHDDAQIRPEFHHVPCTLGMYLVACKESVEGSLRYGRNSYDFQEGSIIFIKPRQVLTYDGHVSNAPEKGWTLFFHPDLLRRSALAKRIEEYSFFSYDLTEALHLSEHEKSVLNDILDKIEREYEGNIDKHSQKLIISNIELLLDYCTRYYDRQFYTRTNLNKDVLTKFEALLSNYFQNENQLSDGVPSVAYCGKELNMSPKYLSDLLKKETGKNAKTHIDEFLINISKDRLLGSAVSISGIAYDLGFEYPQHFSKMFKSKTGMSPSEYRRLN